MRANTKSIVTTLVFALTLVFSSPHANAVDYKTPPSDLVSMQARITGSLVGIDCLGSIGIGMAGSYSISEELKNSGTYSIVLSNKKYLEKCYYRGQQEVKLYKDGSTYKGQTWGSSALNSEDFASLHTVLNLPPLSLYGNVFPEVGWWVTIAAYVPNFGIKWVNSKIYLSNEKEYTFLLDTSDPVLVNGGLVFDNTGQFIGLASSVNNTVSGYTRMVGAPVQCEPLQQTGQGITLCSENSKQIDRTSIWTTRATGSATTQPTPSSSKSPTSGVATAVSALQKSIQAYRDSAAECNGFTSDLDELMHNMGIAEKFFARCNSGDSKVDEIEAKISVLTSSGSISQINTYIDQVNNLATLADATLSEISDAKSQLVALADQVVNLNDSLTASQESWEGLANRLAGIPKSVSVMIFKNSNYKKLLNLINSIDDSQASIDSKTNSFADISSVTQVKSAILGMKTFSTQFAGFQQFDSILVQVQKLVPPYVCVKGSTVSVLPKTGKCAKGSAKTSTS